MPGPSFFAPLGIFVREGFLDPETCSRLVKEYRDAPSEQGGVQVAPDREEVHLEVQKRSIALVVPETKAMLLSKVHEIWPELEKHFDVQVASAEGPWTAVYRPGDYYRPHRDGGDEYETRKISVVIFLNSPEAAEEVRFDGGSLVFYGLFDNAKSKNVGLPLVPVTGTLVAFSAMALHEVQPVTSGERFTAVIVLS